MASQLIRLHGTGPCSSQCKQSDCFSVLSLSGMTVEVLGTVIGTAIQGQIVGMANTPCNTSLTNSSNHSVHGNDSQILLDNKVFNEVRGHYKAEDCFISHQRLAITPRSSYLSLSFTEACVYDCICSHKFDLCPVCCCAVFWSERAGQWVTSLYIHIHIIHTESLQNMEYKNKPRGIILQQGNSGTGKQIKYFIFVFEFFFFIVFLKLLVKKKNYIYIIVHIKYIFIFRM